MKSIIIYSTKYGSAGEIAELLRTKLAGETDVINIMKEQAPFLSGYDNVILGSSVYIGRIQKQMTAYIAGHIDELKTKRIGLFLSAGAPNEEEGKKELNAAFGEALTSQAFAKEVLGHAFIFENMKFLDKLMMSKIKGNSISEKVYDEDKISEFAASFRKA